MRSRSGPGFQSLWPLGGIYHSSLALENAKVIYHRPAEMGETERMFYDATLGDLARSHSAVIAIRHGELELTGLNLLDYFGQAIAWLGFLSATNLRASSVITWCGCSGLNE